MPGKIQNFEYGASMAGSYRFLLALGAAGGEVSGALAHMLWEKVSTKARLAQSYRRLQATGKIEVHGDGLVDERIIRLTADGKSECLAGVDPPALWARPWDGIWRIVAFDIPEIEASLRTRLRRRLHEHRFGWLQNSVWISPDPIDEFRAKASEQHLLPEALTLFEATPAGGEGNESLVTSAWDFAMLDRSHEDYLQVLRLRPNRLRKATSWLPWLETERRAWACVVRRDPFLPRKLHPRGYRGPEVWTARQTALADFRGTLR